MHHPVLVLNANYEPLNVCSTKRAIGLTMTGKAEMLLNGRGYIRTVRQNYPRPSIIRLGYMIKRPYRIYDQTPLSPGPADEERGFSP